MKPQQHEVSKEDQACLNVESTAINDVGDVSSPEAINHITLTQCFELGLKWPSGTTTILSRVSSEIASCHNPRFSISVSAEMMEIFLAITNQPPHRGNAAQHHVQILHISVLQFCACKADSRRLCDSSFPTRNCHTILLGLQMMPADTEEEEKGEEEIRFLIQIKIPFLHSLNQCGPSGDPLTRNVALIVSCLGKLKGIHLSKCEKSLNSQKMQIDERFGKKRFEEKNGLQKIPHLSVLSTLNSNGLTRQAKVKRKPPKERCGEPAQHKESLYDPFLNSFSSSLKLSQITTVPKPTKGGLSKQLRVTLRINVTNGNLGQLLNYSPFYNTRKSVPCINRQLLLTHPLHPTSQQKGCCPCASTAKDPDDSLPVDFKPQGPQPRPSTEPQADPSMELQANPPCNHRQIPQ
uniref:Uncharacterized protein n=1 Tax=Timema douglasi TaxID=61478 RepID=A0A7R8VAL3_TIMDO|nr:unnamed protein product [Timema douglasi]